MPVLENSVAEFVERWREHAANALLYPQPEGSPLLEARLGGRVVYLLDRTGPYTARPGEARVIVHPVAETLAATDETEDRLTVTGVSRLEAVGSVLEVARSVVVVLARVPLVVGVFDESWRRLRAGDRVGVQSLAPVHGFYLGPRRS